MGETRRKRNYNDSLKTSATTRRKKTKYIKQLLCAIYNMRTRTIKTKTSLPWTKLKSFLESEIVLNAEGQATNHTTNKPKENHLPKIITTRALSDTATQMSASQTRHSNASLVSGSQKFFQKNDECVTWEDFIQNRKKFENNLKDAKLQKK